MNTPHAVRRGGSLLLRVLAVSGLAAAAWFVCAGAATADEHHSDEVTATLDAVNLEHGGPQSAAVDQAVAEAVPEKLATFASVTPEPQPFGSGQPFESFAAVDLFAADLAGDDVAPAPLSVMSAPGEHSGTGSESYAGYGYSDDYEGAGGSDGHGSYSGSGGYSNYSHSGTVSNTMPAPLYEAKVAAKTAARAAAVQAQPPAPAAVAVTAPARADVPLFTPIATPSDPVTQTTPNTEVVWEVPEPNTPAPAPKQAPAPSAPTASSGSADNGGGHRGGNVLASLTGQSDVKPPAAWSAERRDDDRSPGSVPGLPSTSPD